jgi:hypothetical protein
MTSLSPLAQRIYDLLVRKTTKTTHGGYMAAWNISKALGEEIGLCGVPGPGVEAMKELETACLVEELPNLGCRYQLTVRAWQSLLAVERAARERAEGRAGDWKGEAQAQERLALRWSAAAERLQAIEAEAAALRGPAEQAVLAWHDYRKRTPMDKALHELGNALGEDIGLAFLAKLAEAEAKAEELRAALEQEQAKMAELSLKARQYDSVVEAVKAADGGRYRADTIAALLGRLRRMSEQESTIKAILLDYKEGNYPLPTAVVKALQGLLKEAR